MNRVAAAAVTGALISGAAMYAVGARTQVSAFTPPPTVQEQDARPAVDDPNALRLSPVQSAAAFQPVATTSSPRAGSPQRVVRPRTAASERVVTEAPAPERTWGKTAMIIGGSAASGAAVGGIVDGKKGALIGAAIGGGAASIYEATRRR